MLILSLVSDFQDCQLSVKQANPRQYVAQIPQVCVCVHLPFSVFRVFCFLVLPLFNIICLKCAL